MHFYTIQKHPVKMSSKPDRKVPSVPLTTNFWIDNRFWNSLFCIYFSHVIKSLKLVKCSIWKNNLLLLRTFAGILSNTPKEETSLNESSSLCVITGLHYFDINLFEANGFIFYLLKHLKTKCFLAFSVGIKREYWPDMHCVKSVYIWSYSSPHLPAFVPLSVFSPNAAKCGPE